MADDRNQERTEGPTDVSGKGWLQTLKRTGKEFSNDDCTDWAAALTYFAVLSLFPALIVLVSLLTLFGGPSVTDKLLNVVGELGPSSAVETFRGPIQSISQSSSGTGLIALIAGIVTALWTASGYTGAFARASNSIYEVGEGRPFWKLRPLQMAITLVLVILVAVVALALIVSGPVAQGVGDAVGVGSTAVTVWQIAKWPVLIVLISVIISALYYSTPNVKPRKFPWVSPGGILAIFVWILASAAFAFYLANFGSYSATYGSLAGIIVFLLWLWITNNAILFGQELNAELERQRELEEGTPGAEDAVQRPWREEPDEEDKHPARRRRPAEEEGT